MYPQVHLYIDGDWRPGSEGKSEIVRNPAMAQAIGQVPLASRNDLDATLAAAKTGFEVWRKTPSFDRYILLRHAADMLRSRVDDIATISTLEQGNPLPRPRARRGSLVISSTGPPRRRAAPTDALSQPAPPRGPACDQRASWSGRRPHAVEFPRSIRPCARFPPPLPRVAR
jgi:hypothetical protein